MRRFRRLAVLGVLTASGVLWLLVGGSAAPTAAAPAVPTQDGDGALLEDGRQLYLTGCSSCHGTEGTGVVDIEGNERGPSLVDAGEASAYYYLATGRMPLSSSEDQPMRKEAAYSPGEIDALVAYVGSLGDGPDLPDIDPGEGDLAEGGVLYRGNCQACHSASGVGGALSYGRAAPNIHPADPLEIATAVRVGPGQMPGFDNDVFDDEQLDALVRYVEYLDQPDDAGGLSLGRVGPIPEGFVTWVIGLGILLAAVSWIGTFRREGQREGGTRD